jgi:hypothetical protein
MIDRYTKQVDKFFIDLGFLCHHGYIADANTYSIKVANDDVIVYRLRKVHSTIMFGYDTYIASMTYYGHSLSDRSIGYKHIDIDIELDKNLSKLKEHICTRTGTLDEVIRTIKLNELLDETSLHK